MASKAVSTAGVKLQKGNGATPTEVFTTIAEVTTISGPTQSSDTIEVTSFDSTAKEYIPALRDSGEVTFEFIFVGEDTSQAALRTDFANGAVGNYKIDCDDATTTLVVSSKYSFAASVTSLSTNFATNDKITGSCTLKISGPVTFTPRAAT